MRQETAETVALRALEWVAGEADLLGVFLGATGVDPAALRAGAAEPEVLASVLEFLTMDDAWVRGFCDAAGLPYAAPMQALEALPGGARMHWT